MGLSLAQAKSGIIKYVYAINSEQIKYALIYKTYYTSFFYF